MKRKGALALAILLIVLFSSFASVPPTSAPTTENHEYVVMYGRAKGCSDLVGQPATKEWKTPYQTRAPWFTPRLNGQNITFGEPWFYNETYGWIVNITVPYTTYDGLEHAWFDKPSETWYRLVVTLDQDGYGWIFLNASACDVDSYTYNTDDGVYWHTPAGPGAPPGASPKSGQKAANTGALPDLGPDGVGGTADDGFGNGTPDPAGSSILLIPSKMHVDFWTGSAWTLMFEGPWPQVFTTANAYDIVIENPPDNELNGLNATETGSPWEFLAGIKGTAPYKGPVPHGHPKWNAFVTYVCAWSVIDQDTLLGDLDVIFSIVETKVRGSAQAGKPSDCVIADADNNQKVNILDILVAAVTFGKYDEGPGGDGIPGTGDDKKDADPGYDARADLADPRGTINILDILKMSVDFGKQITPQCVIKT